MAEGAAVSENAEWIIDLREQQLRDLRAQLAAATQRMQEANQYALSMEAAANAEKERADAAVSALRLATDSTPGKGTGVWMTLNAYQDLLAQIAELEERVKTLQVRQSTAAQDQGEQQ